MPNVADLIAAIKNGKGAKFASFTYVAKETGEKARHTLILGASTEVLYEKDVAVLEQMVPDLKGLSKEAAEAILASRKTSLKVGIGNNPDYTCAGVYVEPDGLAGVKVHIVNGSLHVCGLQEAKVVLVKGVYKTVNSKPLTLAKQEISKSLPSNRFRQFRLDRVLDAKLNGDVLEIKTDADLIED